MPINYYTFPHELASLKGLADRFGLMLNLADENNAMLVGQDFVVALPLDREGVRIWYYDARDDAKVTEYALDYLLYRKRAPGSATQATYPSNQERVQAELRDAIHKLEFYAADVLAGRREWMAEYTWDRGLIQGSFKARIFAVLAERNAKLGGAGQASPRTVA
jgi:hypothetical protein